MNAVEIIAMHELAQVDDDIAVPFLESIETRYAPGLPTQMQLVRYTKRLCQLIEAHCTSTAPLNCQ